MWLTDSGFNKTLWNITVELHGKKGIVSRPYYNIWSVLTWNLTCPQMQEVLPLTSELEKQKNKRA